MEALLLTNEYPPNVYGGAGMHVAELSRQLRNLISLEVRTFGDQHEEGPGWLVRGYLAFPPAWWVLGRQTLLIARRPSE